MMIIEPGPNWSAADLRRLREVAERFPTVPVLFRYAQVVGLNGQPEESARALGLLCKLNSERGCREVLVDWAELQSRHAGLRDIAGVGVPSEPTR
jgi:hypothetical protein